MADTPNKAEGKRPLRVALKGALVTWLIGLLSGVATTLGLLLTPLQKIVFNWMWQERPAVRIIPDSLVVQEGEIVGVNVIVSPATAVGLSGGTVLVAVGNQNARLLLADGNAPSTLVSFPKSDASSVFREQLVVSQPGQLDLVVNVETNTGKKVEAHANIKVTPRPEGACKHDIRNQENTNFAGRWLFDLKDYGMIEVDMHEGPPQVLAGEFKSKTHGSGKFVGRRDGINYFGSFSFDEEPLKQIHVEADYLESRDKAFLISDKGKATVQTRHSKERFDWKDSGTSSTFQGWCTLR